MTMGTAPLLPANVVIQAFTPVAYYDQDTDCIRVFTHDRSITERRVDQHLTIYQTNHRGRFDPEHVGFSLKGVHHLFDEVGLDISAAYNLAEVIDALVKRMPDALMTKVLKDFVSSGPYAEMMQIQVQERLAA